MLEKLNVDYTPVSAAASNAAIDAAIGGSLGSIIALGDGLLSNEGLLKSLRKGGLRTMFAGATTLGALGALRGGLMGAATDYIDEW